MIIPALLANSKEELIEMINICVQFTDYVQIDIMDGKFVPSKSIGLPDLRDLHIQVRCEAHLMVNEPLEWVESFKRIGAEKIIYHFEIEKDHSKVIAKIRESGLKVGIAVNPSTEIGQFEFLIDEVDTILFMSVDPGFYGAQFMPEVLKKIRSFRRKYPQKNIGIDGGVKPDNLLNIKNTGLNYICVGSAILKDGHPKQAYEKLQKLLDA